MPKSNGTVVENVYDVDGVLVRTTTNGVATDLLVDTSGGLSHVVAEVDSSGAVTALYVRAGGMLLEEIRGGVAKMYEADGLGSTRSLLDTTGTQTDTWSYEAFGATLSSTGTSASPYRFAGERFVDNTGMYQIRARWLDTRSGRFISRDRVQRNHPFTYGNDDPVNAVDPSGNDFTLPGLAIGVEILSYLAVEPNAGAAPAGASKVLHHDRRIYILSTPSDGDPPELSGAERGYIQQATNWAQLKLGSLNVVRNKYAFGWNIQEAIDDPDLFGLFVSAHGHGYLVGEYSVPGHGGQRIICPAGYPDPNFCSVNLKPRRQELKQPLYAVISSCCAGKVRDAWQGTTRAAMLDLPVYIPSMCTDAGEGDLDEDQAAGLAERFFRWEFDVLR